MEWDKLGILKPIFTILLVASLLAVNVAFADVATTETFTVYFSQERTFQFQQDNVFLIISVTTGNLNASSNSITQDASLLYAAYWKWLWIFQPLENCTLKLTFPSKTICYVNGNIINSTTIHAFGPGDTITIMWESGLITPLPLSLILGIAGFLCMIFGLSYLLVKLKEKQYDKALITGTVSFLIGFGFFLGWLIS